ncbi:hypothetical protein B0H12DRAFT_447661 [Mycena haematopus]|nr:hypothetical protein B0H12DRAFT_447661 [Mycena haematopus]
MCLACLTSWVNLASSTAARSALLDECCEEVRDLPHRRFFAQRRGTVSVIPKHLQGRISTPRGRGRGWVSSSTSLSAMRWAVPGAGARECDSTALRPWRPSCLEPRALRHNGDVRR